MSLFGGNTRFLSTQSNTLDTQSPPESLTTDSDQDNELDTTEEEVNESDESDEEPTRLNRFRGAAKTWLRHTAEERKIAAALEKSESTDLAIQIYNAYHLKNHAQRPAEQPTEDQEGGRLQPEEVFAHTQTEFEEWTRFPRRPLDILTKRYTDKFVEAVSEASPHEIKKTHKFIEDGEIGNMPEHPADVLKEEVLANMLRVAHKKWTARCDEEANSVSSGEGTGRQKPKARGRSKVLEAGSIKAGSDTEMEDDQSVYMAEQSEPHSGLEMETDHSHRGSPSRNDRLPKPIFLADDDEAKRILGPVVNSVFTQLDDLTSTMERWAESNDVNSGSHYIPGKSSESHPTKKRKTMPRRSVVDINDSTSEYGTTHEGDYETASEPGVKDDDGNESAWESDVDGESNGNSEDRGRVLDWKIVLNLAAHAGFDRHVVARAAQRCEALFGERLAIRAFSEGPAAPPTTRKRPLFTPGTLRCPHKDCPQSKLDFPASKRLLEHIRREHKYDPRTNDSDNEERTVDGVHIDGFMQPITLKKGWVGVGRAKSEDSKKTGYDSDSDADDDKESEDRMQSKR